MIVRSGQQPENNNRSTDIRLHWQRRRGAEEASAAEASAAAVAAATAAETTARVTATTRRSTSAPVINTAYYNAATGIGDTEASAADSMRA